MKSRQSRWIIGLVVGLLLAQTGWGFYNPQTGRWLSRDPIIRREFTSRAEIPFARQREHSNVFRFVRNNATCLFDVAGLHTEEERKSVCDDFEKNSPDEAKKYGGTIVCKNNTPYPCLFRSEYKTFAPEVQACLLAHEKSHADDATKRKLCNPPPNYVCSIHASVLEKLGKTDAVLQRIAQCDECQKYNRPFVPSFKGFMEESECKAYRVLFDCIKGYANSNPRPHGVSTVIGELQDWLDEKPNRCPKEFPNNELPW